MTPVTKNLWADRLAKAAARASRRKDNAAYQAKQAGKPIKPSRKTLIAQLDTLCGLVVKRRDKMKNGVCIICKARPIQVWYHIIPRASHMTRWDLRASVGACAPCNMGEKWHRLAYRHKHVEIFGREIIEELEALSRQRSHFSIADLIEKRDEFMAMLATPLNGSPLIQEPRNAND